MHTNHVISLKSATKRREHIEKEFSRLDIPFCFYDALSPSAQLNNIIKNHLPNLKYAKLSEGEKACFMSHYMLWKECINNNLPYIYIFEDDVLLSNDAHYFLKNYKWLSDIFNEKDLFILRFETILNYSKCKDVNIPIVFDRKILKLIVNNNGTGAYVISKQAISELIEFIQKLPANELCAIDLIMFNRFNKFSYQLNPAICIQENILHGKNSSLISQLNLDREKIHKYKERRKFKDLVLSLCRKPKKILFKIYLKLYKKKHIIPFE